MSVSPFAAPGKSRPGRVRPALAPLLAMPLAMNAADPPGRIALQRWLAATLRSIFRLPCSAHGRQACRLSAIILSRLISAANYPNSRSRRGLSASGPQLSRRGRASLCVIVFRCLNYAEDHICAGTDGRRPLCRPAPTRRPGPQLLGLPPFSPAPVYRAEQIRRAA